MAYLEDYRRTIYLDKLGGVDPHLVYETIDILGGVGINKFVFVPTVYNLTNAYAEIIANINAAYPNASNSIFMGRFTKGTEGFYILYTYGNNGQQEYPEYSVGMLMQWAGETISSFGTVSQVPYSRSVSLTTT